MQTIFIYKQIIMIKIRPQFTLFKLWRFLCLQNKQGKKKIYKVYRPQNNEKRGNIFDPKHIRKGEVQICQYKFILKITNNVTRVERNKKPVLIIFITIKILDT